MRLIQELADALVRVLSLKRKGDYAEALLEIDETLAKLQVELSPDSPLPDLTQLIAVCVAAGDSPGEQMTILADLFSERADLLERQQRAEETLPSRILALGLYLESMQQGRVKMEELRKAEQLIELTRGHRLPGPLLMRLLNYYEARVQYARAEDALFDWLEQDRSAAMRAGLEFYQRLLTKPEEDLKRGDLPRAEVVEGMAILRGRI